MKTLISKMSVAQKLLLSGVSFAAPIVFAVIWIIADLDAFANDRLIISVEVAIIICAVLFLIAVYISILMAKSLRSLETMIKIADEIAAGKINSAKQAIAEAEEEFRAEIAGGSSAKSEIIRLFVALGQMTRNIDDLLRQARSSGIQLKGASNQIASSAGELKSAIAGQAASTNEINATSSEISATTKDLSKSLSRVATLFEEIARSVGDGLQALSEIKGAMTALQSATSNIFEKLRAVNAKTDSISQITETITKVANQTNLLSLNAAIEAEKAGEKGAGFSVVAREIRRLADQTSHSALDIEDMISKMQNAVKDGVDAVESFTAQTRTSAEKTAKISEGLEKLMAQTKNLAPQLKSVDEGMRNQSESAAQINQAIGQLNEAAGKTKDSIGAFYKTSESLNASVRELQTELSKFSVG